MPVGFTVPLTIDNALELRRCIKAVAFRHGVTVPNTLRELLGRGFPNIEGEAP
ncbi:conserved hypothetical protein [Methylocella tundrae]|uniref:Uncharacterized protein n=1 Tax=Methylocella tundrae TaxID=227605 RepID=A0A8B6M7U8_METTU|nr:hypothetical protein [Methylocella tundrae]VTZ26129.1 conserved hypothetical protein [Methylocella tundrae]VTZ50511.1 conserved hypothetical protein [Methylocella tundrae]